MEPASSWTLVRFVSAEPQLELQGEWLSGRSSHHQRCGLEIAMLSLSLKWPCDSELVLKTIWKQARGLAPRAALPVRGHFWAAAFGCWQLCGSSGTCRTACLLQRHPPSHWQDTVSPAGMETDLSPWQDRLGGGLCCRQGCQQPLVEPGHTLPVPSRPVSPGGIQSPT